MSSLSEDQKKKFEKYLKSSSEEHFNLAEDVNYRISTGSLKFDSIIGGGFGPGIIRLSGASEGGKTNEALEIANNFLDELKQDGMVCYIKAEGRLSQEIQDRQRRKFVKKIDDWNSNNIFIFKSNIYERVVDWIDNVLTILQGKKVLFIIDSLDGLSRRADVEKGITGDENIQVAGVPWFTNQFLKMYGSKITELGHMAILLSQVRAKIQATMNRKKEEQLISTATGGNAAVHFAEWMFNYDPRIQSNNILENDAAPDFVSNKILGHWASLTISKSTNETSGYRIKYPIKHNVKGKSSIWREYEIADMFLSESFYKKNGSWLSMSEKCKKISDKEKLGMPESIQGVKNLMNCLAENPKACNFWYNYFVKYISDGDSSDLV